MVLNKTFNSFSYSTVVEDRIVIISIEKRQEVKQICKLYCIIEGDEWCGKEQHEEVGCPPGCGEGGCRRKSGENMRPEQTQRRGRWPGAILERVVKAGRTDYAKALIPKKTWNVECAAKRPVWLAWGEPE